MTTVGVTRAWFALKQRTLSDSCPGSAAAGHVGHTVASQRVKATAHWKNCHTFQNIRYCKVVPSVTLNHALQNKHAAVTFKQSREWICEGTDFKHINAAWMLATRAISCVQNHPVMPPCAREKAPPPITLSVRQTIELSMLKNSLNCQSKRNAKGVFYLEVMKDEEKTNV